MFYRVHQFIQAFAPRIKASELNWVYENLPPNAFELFLKQSLPEQRHALNVALALINDDIANHSVCSSNFQNLLVAALLHDCGKSVKKIRLWQRVFIVVMQQLPLSIWSRVEKSRTFLATPLSIAREHALWGSTLAEEAGLNFEICRLIREHHAPQTDLGRLLEKADNKH